MAPLGSPAPLGGGSAVAVRDLQAGIEAGGDLDERAQQRVSGLLAEGVLASEVLHGAQPVDVRQELTEPVGQQAQVLARPQVEGRRVGPRQEPRVHAALRGGHEGDEEQRDQRVRLHVSSRDRKAAMATPSTAAMYTAA